ncbi:MAG: hypothetical protein ACRYFX_19490 [Janthinobacterium lividum]
MKYLLVFPIALVAGSAFGQQIEFSGRASATAANFRGESAVTSSYVQGGSAATGAKSYTQNPYGKDTGIGFGAGIRAQRVAKTGFLTALDLGYDFLHTKTDILYVNTNSTVVNNTYSASGTTHLYTQYATGFIGAGWRAKGQTLSLDGLVGPELAYVLRALDYGSGTQTNGVTYSVDTNRTPANSADFRLRADATVWATHLGLAVSYSYGLTNYYPANNITTNPQAYSNALRLGLAYRLK